MTSLDQGIEQLLSWSKENVIAYCVEFRFSLPWFQSMTTDV
jgi:hypothetical protein